MSTKKALVTGSFDPVTTGHVDIIRRAAELFDWVDAVVFINPAKAYTFDEKQRLEMLALACNDIDNVRAFMDKGYVSDYVKRNNIDVIVRGIRSENELEYEISMADYNRAHSGVQTIFIPADEKYVGVSSTLARQRIISHESLEGIIPIQILDSGMYFVKK